MALSPLASAALAVLCERPAHAYDVLATLQRRLDDLVVKVRPGTLYHAIGRLAVDGLVVETATERCGNRPERTVYAITDAGREAFHESVRAVIAEPRYEYPRFPAALAEISHLGRADAMAALRRRHEVLGEEYALWTTLTDRIAERGLPSIYWLDKAWVHAMLRAEIAWLADVIAAVERDDILWSAPLPATTPPERPPFPSPIRQETP